MYRLRLHHSHRQIYIDRMSSEPNLSAKWSFTIGIMINFDGDFDGHGTEMVCVNKPLQFNN